MESYSHPDIELLMKIENNTICFDCGHSKPKWASLNNAVFVCLKCAGVHRSFGVNVSFIRSLTIDSWDERQIEFLKKGGNKRLNDFLKEFNVPENATMDFKYMIRATDYYRKLIRSEVNADEPPFKPDIISGLEMLDFGINHTPHFDNNKFISNTNNNNNKGGFLSNLSSFMNKAKQEIKSTAEKVGDKIKEMELGDKLKYTSERGLIYAKATGNLIYQKGKEVYVNKFLIYFRIRKLFKIWPKKQRKE